MKTRKILTSSEHNRLKVIKTCKISGKINITVKLFMTPPATPTKKKMISSVRSSPGLESKIQDSYMESLSIKDSIVSQDPRDFIEPPQNLTIPSLQEYILHTSDHKHNQHNEAQPLPNRQHPLKPPLSPKLYQNTNTKFLIRS
ncbi:hypothetical protein SteCoe_15902 [Stentor coeruleus]|uniref:Uncharacterized protein n=1 Tax=Stentor coeruleus TaxID=5963 RepID=A0A1R2C2M5_9CILI|nr:hypothetical protein SteCoe_15902 [Stentor coeruleus]